MEYSYKKIWTITYPVLISLLMQDLIGLTDTAFLGRVGETELGASAIATIYYMVIYMVGFGFSVGAEILMGRRNGEGEHRRIGEVFTQGTIFLMILAIVMFVLSRRLSPLILRNVIASEDVYRATVSYIDWRAFGFFFSFIAIMFRAYYMAITKTRILTINAFVMLLTNVLLNYVLIFGKFGFPKLGIAGAAIGSSVSELVSVLFFVIYTRRKTDYKKYGLFNFGKISLRIQKEIFRVSGWTMVQFFIATGTWLFFFLAIEHLGERPLAITNMVRNISALVFLFISAFGSSGTAIISNVMGTGHVDQVRPIYRKIMKMCGIVLLPVVLFIVIFPTVPLRLFSDDPEIISSAIPSLMVMVSSFIFNLPGFILFFAVSGTGDTKAAFRIEMTTLIFYVAYVWYLAVYLKVDVALCWTSEIVYAVSIFLLSLRFFRKGDWRYKKV